MAECKDCIHGEVCDIFVNTRTLICNDKADKMCKLFKATADVVPKSEVEELQAECNKWQERLKTECEYTEGITKKKVAREIFEEIEKIVDNNTYKSYLPNSSLWCKEYKSNQIIVEIAELKKKYT